MIDKNISAPYMDLICEDCKAKITEQMKSLKKTDILFPRKVMNKFTNILCSKCFKKVVKAMQRRGKI